MLEHHSRLAATCKIAKPPFWFIWTTPFAFGYVASAGSDPRHAIWAVFAGLGICLGDMVCNLHNELVDRDEDAINQPERTALLRDAGEAALKALVVSGYTVAGVGLLLVALVVSLDVAAWFAFAALLSLLYNAGLHLKRRSGLAQMAIRHMVYGDRPVIAPSAAWLMPRSVRAA